MWWLRYDSVPSDPVKFNAISKIWKRERSFEIKEVFPVGLVRICLCSCHYCQFSSFLFFIFSWDYMYISFYFLVQIISTSTSLSSVRQQRTISSLRKKSSGLTKVYKSVFFIFIFWFIKILINHINWRQINWSSSIKCNRRRFFRWNGSSVFSLIFWVIGIVTNSINCTQMNTVAADRTKVDGPATSWYSVSYSPSPVSLHIYSSSRKFALNFFPSFETAFLSW